MSGRCSFSNGGVRVDRKVPSLMRRATRCPPTFSLRIVAPHVSEGTWIYGSHQSRESEAAVKNSSGEFGVFFVQLPVGLYWGS
jgi:hypothetical protein